MIDEEDADGFVVTIDYNKFTLQKKGLAHLAYECYADEIIQGTKEMQAFFAEKQHVDVFMEFLERHLKKKKTE